MDRHTLLVLLVCFHTVHIATASWRYGDCLAFGPKEEPLEPTDMEHDCVYFKSVKYCHYWSCPKFPDIDCPDPHINHNGRCLCCSDECVHEGELHSVDSHFESIDHLNTCFCTIHGVNCTTYPKDDVKTFCDM